MEKCYSCSNYNKETKYCDCCEQIERWLGNEVKEGD